jgi:hypothetical protein
LGACTAAKAEKRRRRRLEEWEREELRRTPFAPLDDPARRAQTGEEGAEEVIMDRAKSDA